MTRKASTAKPARLVPIEIRLQREHLKALRAIARLAGVTLDQLLAVVVAGEIWKSRRRPPAKGSLI